MNGIVNGIRNKVSQPADGYSQNQGVPICMQYRAGISGLAQVIYKDVCAAPNTIE